MGKKIFLFALLIAVSTTAAGCKQNGQKTQPNTENRISATDTLNTQHSTSDNQHPTLNIKDITSQVTWGYRQENRTKNDIDIIVVHSNYHVVNQAKQQFDFDVDGCIKQFKDGGTSAHYMITRDGTILKMVDEKNVAYHAGKSALPYDSRK